MKKSASLLLIGFAILLSLSAAAGPKTGASRTDVRISGNIISTLNPFTTTLGADVQMHSQIYESFLHLDDYSKPHPRLAERYTISKDGLVYTFYLRKGARFHNGDEVKASDAVFSFNTAMKSANMSAYTAPIKEVKAIDAYTVAITLTDVYVPFLINTFQIRIVSERAVTQAGARFGLDKVDCGSGPYRISSYEPKSRIILEASPDYYLGEASIKKIVYETITDASTQLIAFENGELDFLAIPTANWKAIESSGKYTTMLAPVSRVCYIALNFYMNGALKNKTLRQAVQYAIDRDAIIAAAYGGIGEAAGHMVNPKFVAGAPSDSFEYRYDPQKAKELMAKAGYPQGVDLGTVLCPSSSYFPKVAQVLQALLAEVGMKVKIVAMESASASASARKGEYDFYINQNTFVMDYDAFSRYCHSRNLSAMVVKYNNKELDALFDDGAAEMDPKKRVEIYKKTDNWIQDFSAHIPTFYPNTPYAWHKNLSAKVGLYYYYVYEWSWK
jgi:ABC-type transport system substrate-binding protein